MAQKRASGSILMDQQQPSPSSSEDDSEETSSSSEEETEDEHATPPAPASATTNPKPNSKKPPPPPPPSTAKSQPPASSSDDSATESDSGSGSESESDYNDPPTASSIPKAKPLAAKSLEESQPKPKPKPKPQSPPQPSTAQARSAMKSASKRAGDNMQNMSDPKKAKKKATDAAGGREDEIPAAAEEGGGKKLFQRIWSEEDEIAILKGLAEFTSKSDVDPCKDVNPFHEFIKNSLHWDASSNQLKEKIRRLKKKFEKNTVKGKDGEGPKFTKPHEDKAFELSKKVWVNAGGSNGGAVDQVKPDAKTKKSKKESNSRTIASPKPKVESVQRGSKDAEKTEAVENGIGENGGSNVHLSEMIQFDNTPGMSGLNEDVMKRGLQLIGASKRAELQERWKDLQVTELELYVKRAELIKDQAKLIWEAYKSSNH